jgi:hypothetical protein
VDYLLRVQAMLLATAGGFKSRANGEKKKRGTLMSLVVVINPAKAKAAQSPYLDGGVGDKGLFPSSASVCPCSFFCSFGRWQPL